MTPLSTPTRCLLMAGWLTASSLSQALPITADSFDDFSGVQGQSHWYYGFFKKRAPNGPAYSVRGFREYDSFGPYANTLAWWASPPSLGVTAANYPRYPNWRAIGGHPNGIGPAPQTGIFWTVLRYESPVDGIADISYELAKSNVGEPKGGGITGRIFIDGVQVFARTIGNTDDVGVKGTIRAVNVHVDSDIDFVIDPLGFKPLRGRDSLYSARADGTHFIGSLAIQPQAAPRRKIAEAAAVVDGPSTLSCLLAGLTLLCSMHGFVFGSRSLRSNWKAKIAARIIAPPGASRAR
jgi:hypothetical protein